MIIDYLYFNSILLQVLV